MDKPECCVAKFVVAEKGKTSGCPGPQKHAHKCPVWNCGAKTKMSQDLQQALGDCYRCGDEDLFQEELGERLQCRPQATNGIASAALFLISDQSSAITGQILNVDGGMTFY
jgi:NAD(P)-dependent dehydrogenase (short-subunit alcohol dehydrogenase family)